MIYEQFYFIDYRNLNHGRSRGLKINLDFIHLSTFIKY